jgi:ABC-type multidrug transport system permease subunit
MFVMYGTLWASHVDSVKARPYALSAAILITELFAVISFLPTGFYTNAAFLALSVYVLLGLSREDVLHKLSKEVLRRYVILFCVLTLAIALTSQWI